MKQSHEVIGNPPNVSVPTHFAKVVLTTKPATPSTPEILEVATGAFVLPNAIIPDEAPLTSFVVPGNNHLSKRALHALMRVVSLVEAVERAAGLTLFSEEIKRGSRHICQSTKCEVVVRRFDDAQKNSRKAIAAPKS